MTAGCLLFIPASNSSLFAVFLVALFVLAAGITVVQVVANPLISLLGPPATAHSRLTFAQAFNSVGTTVFPYVGSILILGSLSKVNPAQLTGAAQAAYRTAETHVIVSTYLGLAAVLVVMAAVVWLRRQRLPRTVLERASLHGYLELLRRVRFIFGAGCIFLYVGAEVAIGSLMVSYLMQSNVFDLGPEAAGKKLIYYWGGAMVGRFIGAYLLRVFSPGKVLASVAAVAIALLCISGSTTGLVCGCALLAVGLFNSIMFPTIFALAVAGMGDRTAQASGIICLAIVGGAVVPLTTGVVADHLGLKLALLVPALCYIWIAFYGIFTARSKVLNDVPAVSQAPVIPG
jgi:FHS family L-fucose permease-like MFS transporter